MIIYPSNSDIFTSANVTLQITRYVRDFKINALSLMCNTTTHITWNNSTLSTPLLVLTGVGCEFNMVSIPTFPIYGWVAIHNYYIQFWFYASSILIILL